MSIRGLHKADYEIIFRVGFLTNKEIYKMNDLRESSAEGLGMRQTSAASIIEIAEIVLNASADLVIKAEDRLTAFTRPLGQKQDLNQKCVSVETMPPYFRELGYKLEAIRNNLYRIEEILNHIDA